MTSEQEENDPREVVVEVRDLVRYYGDLKAVAGVSFNVHAGEIFGLLGPNGAGKSTTMRVLATLISPDEGSASICGFDTTREVEEVRRRIGFQTGDTRLYERLTPREFLRYFGRLHDMAPTMLENRIEELVLSLGIGEYKNRRCGTLSTGQKQRVSIARALLHNPEVLILDEPTSGLDIISSQFILEFLRGARTEGKTIIYSTHIMSEAELICDRLGLLYKGRLLRVDTLGDLLADTGADSLTRAFLECISEHDEDAARAIKLSAQKKGA